MVLFFGMLTIPSTLPIFGEKNADSHGLASICLDLNIIEAIWDHLDREINERQPKSKEELGMY